VDDLDSLHALDPGAFHERVRSFDHWFGAVEGYLHGLENGHRVMSDEAPVGLERDRLIGALCTYCVGETAALEASSGLVRIAPNRPAQIFMATQAVDEARHVEVLIGRLRELGVSDPEAEVARRAAPSMTRFREQLLRLVDAQEWDSALFAQNVMLESMEFVVFDTHARRADPVTRDILERILRDERRHLGFGENEIAGRIAERRERRSWIEAVKVELDALALETFEHAARELGLPRRSEADLARRYLAAVARLGIAEA